MRKERETIKAVFLLFIATIFLSGCSQLRGTAKKEIQDQIWSESGVAEDASYKQYNKYKESGQLDKASGMDVNAVKELQGDDGIKTDGKIHVTFADNQNITVSYFLDEKHTQALVDDCYLNPGDTIYCVTPQGHSIASNTYHFSCFHIFQFADDGTRSEDPIVTDGKNGIVYKIPDDFSGEGLSIEPIGKFANRVLTLHDYFVDENGKTNELSGTWTVNDVDYNVPQVEVESTDDVAVEYNYDSNNYFVVKTEPKDYSNSISKGIVSFSIASSTDDINKYNVYLKHYITLSFSGKQKKGIKSIKVNGETKELNDNKLDHLKYDDQILITTNDNYEVNCLALASVSAGDNQFLFKVPDNLNKEDIDAVITDKNNSDTYHSLEINNGTLQLRYVDINDGATIKNDETIDDNTKVKVIIKPNDGYYLTGKNVKSGVYQKEMKYSSYRKDIKKIVEEHQIKKFYSVKLDTKDKYGKVTYTLDGKNVSGKVSNLREDQKLKLYYSLNENSNYVIDRENPTGLKVIPKVLNDTFKSDSEEKEIDITSDIDGKTITRNQYIKIKKKGD